MLTALGASSCSKTSGNILLIENPTVISTTATVEGIPPAVGALQCEALGVSDRRGNFVPITYLSGRLPRGAGQNIVLEHTNSFRVYRGTNRVAANNLFLGEYLVTDFPTSAPATREVVVDFEISEKRELQLYARADAGTSDLYTLKRIDNAAK